MLTLVIVVLASIGVTLAPAASAATETQSYRISIAPAALSNALIELARQTGLQIAQFSDSDAFDLQVGPLAGDLTRAEALTRLLANTGLTYRFVNDRTVAIVRDGLAETKATTDASTVNVDGTSITTHNDVGGAMQHRGFFLRLGTLLGVCASTVGSVCAQEAANSDGSRIEEVMVTAQKRVQSLQDVSLSISALSGDDLQNKQINDVRDLGSSIPNVSVSNYLGGAQIVVRGIGNTNPFTGADPSVALHVDGAVISQPQAQLGSFFDLERIEVLRGPQGTLYGRNATGGVMNLVTRRPTAEQTGYVHSTFGNYDLIGTEAAISGAVKPGLLHARLAAKTEDHSGYGRNEFTGNDIDDTRRRAARGQLELLPTADLNVLLSAEWSSEDDANYGPKFRAPSYPGTTLPSLLPAGRDGWARNVRDVNSDTDTQNKRETYGITGTVDWRLSDLWSLKSISNYRDFNSDNVWDFGTSPAIDNTVQNLIVDSASFSQELQLSLQRDRLSLQMSAYYFRENLYGDNRVGRRPQALIDAANQRMRVRYTGNIHTDSEAAFFNGGYRLTDSLTLNLGARYTREKRSGHIVTRLFNATTSAFESETPFDTGDTFDDFSPKATLEWRPVDGVMTYATYSKGFKSGVIIIGGSKAPILRPEKVVNYEIGAKTTLFERRLALNVAVFHEDYSDMQVFKSLAAVNSTINSSIFENAAKSTVDGAELEMSWNITPQLNVHGSTGFLDATFEDYESSDPLDLPNAPLLQLEGRMLPFAPKWSSTAGFTYGVPLAAGKISLSGDMQSKSRHYPNQFNNAVAVLKYTTYAAAVKYTSPSDNFSLSLWSKNLTDRFYWVGSSPNSTSKQIQGNQGDPRTIGVTVTYDF